MAYYIGLMSGTSVDAIDAVLCDIEDSHQQSVQLLHSLSLPFPQPIQQQVHRICEARYEGDPVEEVATLDQTLGNLFAEAVQQLLKAANVKPRQVIAIGSHGQTIRHRPQANVPFSLQIGNPHRIAALTDITTVADFRSRDLVFGGQGAPLVPAFHQALFHHPQRNRVIVNLGGIANITVLPRQGEVIGYDTGPANTLLDQWIARHQQKAFDANGQWAAQGSVIEELLTQLTADPYFRQPYPKSTGREYFNLEWLMNKLSPDHSPVDVQATLLELTAYSLSQAIRQHFQDAEIIVCGGGAYNSVLLQRISELLPDSQLSSSAEHGVAPDWIEAMAFAWLADQCLKNRPVNLKSVTGAQQNCILGAIYPA